MLYEIRFTDLGRSSLKTLQKNVQRDVVKALWSLGNAPKSGKPLVDALFGLHAIRVRSQYRIVYGIDDKTKTIRVELVGVRRPGRKEDIYQVAQKLLKSLGH